MIKVTILGIDVQMGKNVWVKDKERRSGAYILGVQGRGKSSLIESLIHQDMIKGYATIVFDPHEDLINHAVAQMPEERLNKTYILDVTDTDYPFGLNLFISPENEIERAIAVDRVMHVFEKLWPETKGILLEKLLRYITLTFLEHPGHTLADIPLLLRDSTYRASIVNRLTNQDVKEYWQNEYDAMSPGERRTETQALTNRLSAFLGVPYIKNIVSQQKNTLDFQRAILEQEVLFIRLPYKRMKGFASLIGTILLAQLHAATFAFGEVDWDQRPGYSLYIDEFQNFATSDFAELYKEGRKFGVRITVAHQDRQDLLPENRSATLTASTIVSFQPTPHDAAELAPVFFDSSLKLRPERFYSDILPRLRLHAHEDVQEYFRRFILPLQKKGSKHAHDQDILDAFQDTVYQAVKTRAIDDELLDLYLRPMFSHLHLTFTSPHQKQKQLQEDVQIQDYQIAHLQSLFVSEKAFESYLVDYYTFYSLYAYHHPIDWYYQPWISEEHLLADTKFWEYVWGYRSHVPWKSHDLKELLTTLREEAVSNDALVHRDTPEKLIADEKAKLVTEWKRVFQLMWKDIAKIYKIKSTFATHDKVRAFYLKEYQMCQATPIESKSHPLFLHIRQDFVTQPLPFESDRSMQVAEWLPDSIRTSDYEQYGNAKDEAFRARFTVQELWRTITWYATEMPRIKQLHADNTAILKTYYAEVGKWVKNRGLWEQINTEQVNRNVWDALAKEAERNTLLSRQMNTLEKIIEVRKHEVRKKIELLIQERNSALARLPEQEMQIQQEITEIQERRTEFENYVRGIIQILIDDPDTLGEPRKIKESDIREMLLNLQKRQALVRVSGDIDQKPQISTIQTANAPQAVKKDELERRLHMLQEQTRAKYCRPRHEVEQDLAHTSGETSQGKEKRDEGDQPNSWYEE